MNHWEAWESSEEYLWCAAIQHALDEAEEEEDTDFFFDWLEAIDPQWAASWNGAGEIL